MVFAFVILLVIGLVTYVVLGSAAASRSKQRVRSVGREFTDMLTAPEVNYARVNDRIISYSFYDSIDVFLFDSDGNVIIGVPPFDDIIEDVYDSVAAASGEWRDGKETEFNSREHGNMTISYVACIRCGNEMCRLLVRYPVAPIARTISQMELYVLLIALAALALAFFISYTLANKLSSPIRDVSATAKKLAKGDYSVQFTSTQYAEVAQLSDTLNYMKDEIKKSDQFQKELLANVSHDLKTPLTMIKAYASMIMEISGDDPEKRKKHLQVIIDESDRLAGLVNDILSTSKISAGLEQLDKKVFNVSEALYGVINNFGYLQESQGYKIMVDVDPNQYTLADEEKIKQVFYNLISNAVNYTGEDKTIYVMLKFVPQSGSIRFEVRDTGKGIAQDELQHIWDRYYRSKETHNRPVKGTGLGLNIVKAILESHSFGFGAESAEGKGSTFFVDFPAVSSVPDDETPTE